MDNEWGDRERNPFARPTLARLGTPHEWEEYRRREWRPSRVAAFLVVGIALLVGLAVVP